MKVKVAIISPESFIQHMMEVGETFPLLELFPFTYREIREAADIVKACKDDVDVLFFAGPIPYQVAYEYVEQTPMIYLPHSGTSLYRALFQIVKEGRYNEEKGLRISVDILDRHEVLERMEELDIKVDRLFVHEYQLEESTLEIADYHAELWKSQQVDTVMTCYNAVYEELMKRQVPCHRINPSKRTIAESFQWVQLEGRSHYLKGSQLAIGVLNIDLFSESKSLADSDMRKKKLVLQNLLMEYGEEIEALMEWTKRDEMTFITTRGNIEKSTKGFSEFPLSNGLFTDLGIRISMGIGLGHTASDAELKAREALSKAKAGKDSSCFVMIQDGNVYGPLGQLHNLSYSARTESPELLELAKQASLSVGTINKIIAYCRKFQKKTLTTAELANGFGITVRSARRILSKLEERGLAEVVGEEQPISKGRPRQIYNITFHIELEDRT